MSKDVVYRRLVGSKRWANLARAIKVQAGWMCSICGRVTHRMAVHHIVPVETGKDLREMTRLCFNPTNCQVVCFQCHSDIHQSQRRQNRELGRQRETLRVNRFLENVATLGVSARMSRTGARFFSGPPQLRKSTGQNREVREEVSESGFSPTDGSGVLTAPAFDEDFAPVTPCSPTTTGIGDALEDGMVFDGEDGLIYGVDFGEKEDDLICGVDFGEKEDGLIYGVDLCDKEDGDSCLCLTVESDGSVTGAEEVSGGRLREVIDNYRERKEDATEEHD